MSRKTLGLIIVLLILTIILVMVAILTKPQKPQQISTTDPTPTPTPLVPGRTSLSLTPNPLSVSGSTSSTLDIAIDTGGNEVRSVQLEIAYDPKAITNVTLKPGTFFTNPSVLPIGGVNPNSGRVTYALVPNSSNESRSGTGIVATMTFTPLLTSTNPKTEISLLEKSLVSGEARGQNVLIKTTGTTIILKNPTVTTTSQ
ncbi:MAG: hypothetical protein HZC02_04740 [Candidatus Levybacteria bacterium]|nr:hypothetical protein [Candidatus Levybacteria bacterium]